MFTGDNKYFFRKWFEIDKNFISLKLVANDEVPAKHYVPVNKGGAYRKWYGNHDTILKFDADSFAKIGKNQGHRSPELYFHPSVTWTKITSGAPSFRYTDVGFINNDASMSVINASKESLLYELAVLNTKVSQRFLTRIIHALNF